MTMAGRQRRRPRVLAPDVRSLRRAGRTAFLPMTREYYSGKPQKSKAPAMQGLPYVFPGRARPNCSSVPGFVGDRAAEADLAVVEHDALPGRNGALRRTGRHEQLAAFANLHMHALIGLAVAVFGRAVERLCRRSARNPGTSVRSYGVV